LRPGFSNVPSQHSPVAETELRLDLRSRSVPVLCYVSTYVRPYNRYDTSIRDTTGYFQPSESPSSTYARGTPNGTSKHDSIGSRYWRVSGVPNLHRHQGSKPDIHTRVHSTGIEWTDISSGYPRTYIHSQALSEPPAWIRVLASRSPMYILTRKKQTSLPYTFIFVPYQHPSNTQRTIIHTSIHKHHLDRPSNSCRF